MGVTNDDQFEQTDEWAHGAHLFDPAPFDTPKRNPATMHPGDLTHEEWLQRPDVVYHGTLRDSMHQGWGPPSFHAGTLKSAEDRMRSLTTSMGLNDFRQRQPGKTETQTVGQGLVDAVNRNMFVDDAERAASVYSGFDEENWYEYAEDDPDAYDPETGEVDERRSRKTHVDNVMTHGKIFGTRVPSATPERLDDGDANRVDAEYWWSGAEDPPPSVRNSAGGSEMTFYGDDGDEYAEDGVHLLEAMDRGTSVPYLNIVEDRGSTSYVVPTGSRVGYWDDVIDSPNRSKAEKEHAALQQKQFGEPPVPFTAHTVENSPQGRLFESINGRLTASPSFPNREAKEVRDVRYVTRPKMADKPVEYWEKPQQ